MDKSRIIGYSCLVMGYFITLYTFFGALISPGMQTTVYVNDYNEALIELFFLVLSFPSVYHVFIEIRDSFRKKVKL